jgi:cytidine deaminase
MYKELAPEDKLLIDAATKVIEKNFQEPRHTVGAAVLCGSGNIYAAVNVESCGYGPCAEPIAIGMAISNGERIFNKIVAISKPTKGYVVLSPCGNCRQLLVDYAPNLEVILPHNGQVLKASIKDILPDSYNNF